MTEQAEFIRAWRTWRRMPVPTENFRLSRSQAPTYVTELALDHLVSSVNSTVEAFFEGKPWEHRDRIADDLETLHTVEADLARSLAEENRQREIQGFITATRLVLHSLLSWLSARDQA